MSGSAGAPGRRVEVQDEVVGEVRGEDQRRAFDGKDDGGLEEAGDVVGVSGAQRRGDGRLDGGKSR